MAAMPDDPSSPLPLFGVSVAPGGRGGTTGGARSGAPTRVRRSDPDPDQLAGTVRAGDRSALARAITLTESTRPDHRRLASELLTRLMPVTGNARRIGITGAPGVGKSSFIETLGCRLIERGERVAVLAVDPSSSVTGGSILGDKTRMERLAGDERAFIRPTPAGATLGGVAARTRETLLLCEAAGFGVVLVETVGVGQSETVVADMTDFFLALMLPGAGDELQGIKRGLVELADMIAVNKADGDRVPAALAAAAEYRAAMRSVRPRRDGWATPVVTCSATTGVGVDELWAVIEQRLEALRESGALVETRRRQLLSWTRALVRDHLDDLVLGNDRVRAERERVEAMIVAGAIAPGEAADRILGVIQHELRNGLIPGKPR
jgi:LAO/AO transport system kinase